MATHRDAFCDGHARRDFLRIGAAGVLGANVLVETVFAWPGIGLYAVNALITSDYAPVQGFVLAMAILYLLLNLAIDVLYGVIDPRVAVEA